MIDICFEYLTEFFKVFPLFILVVIIFDFLGSFLFGK